MDNKKIGNFIKELRSERGWSQYQLADKIPITRQAVSKWECGTTAPDSTTFMRLSEIFEVSIDELVTGERKTKNTPTKLKDVTLSVIDENNSKEKKIKRIILINAILFLILGLLFLTYYFVTSYNSIKFYKVNGDGENFIQDSGILIITKQKFYFQSGNLIYDESKDISINKLQLCYSDGKKEKVIFSSKNNAFLIADYYGYDLFFKYENMNKIINNFYLVVNYNDNQIEKIPLKLRNDFSNNKFFSNKLNLLLDNINKNFSEKHEAKLKEIEKGDDDKKELQEKAKEKFSDSAFTKVVDSFKDDTLKGEVENVEEKDENDSEEKKSLDDYPDVLFYLENKNLLIKLIKKTFDVEDSGFIKNYVKEFHKGNRKVSFNYLDTGNVLEIYAEDADKKYQCNWLLDFDIIKLSIYQNSILIQEENIFSSDIKSKNEKYGLLASIIFEYLDLILN